MPGADNIYSSEAKYGDTNNTILLKLWYWFYRIASGGITATVSEATVTPHFEDLTAGQAQVIPVGAKGWSAIILTGTATINGKAAPAGVAIGDNNTLLATVTVTCDTPGTALVAWNT